MKKKGVAKKTNKQVKINFIISCLKKGEMRAKIMAKAGKKWEISKSSFDRLLRIAKDQHAEEQEKIRKKVEKLDEKAALEARKKDIMNSNDRKELLTKIAKGEIKIPTKEVRWDGSEKKFVKISVMELANHNTRINAIAELNRMEGDYAPTKVENTGEMNITWQEQKTYRKK